jgi:hypothetical protein
MFQTLRHPGRAPARRRRRHPCLLHAYRSKHNHRTGDCVCVLRACACACCVRLQCFCAACACVCTLRMRVHARTSTTNTSFTQGGFPIKHNADGSVAITAKARESREFNGRKCAPPCDTAAAACHALLLLLLLLIIMSAAGTLWKRPSGATLHSSRRGREIRLVILCSR